MDLGRLSTGERVMGGAGAALVVDLLLLPWHSYTIFDVRVRWQAVDEPNRFFGIVAVLVALGIVATVAIRATGRELPPAPWGDLRLYAAAAAVVFLFLKLLQETSGLGYGAWLGLALAGAMTYGAWSERRLDAPA